MGVALVVVFAGIAAFLFREPPKRAVERNPYAANIKFSDFKMSAADNFVGATVTYIDGTVSNTGDKTLARAVVEVIFKDSMGQMAQRENVALQMLRTSGPYPEAVDLGVSPLGPGQSKAFRLTFDSISAQWNHEYPEVQVEDLSVR
jgi:hypothetical protein